MKKLITVGLLAIGCIAFSQNQASAWVNSKFGIGLNWDWQAGGNSVLWGLWRNGQIPGPEMTGGMPRYGMPPLGGFAPMPQPYPMQGFAPAGFAPQAFAPPGFAPQPFPPQGFAPQAFAPPGFAPQAFPAQGFAPQAFPAQGFAPPMFPAYPPAQVFPQPMVDPSFAGLNNDSPYHFANYSRTVYYYYYPINYYGQ